MSRQIELAYSVGSRLSDNLEVIAINGGTSKDLTFEKIKDEQKKHPDLMIVNKSENTEGYAVIKYGLAASTKDWVFYTDGDAQYHLEEDMEKLVRKQEKTNADVINGYKRHRGDSFIRIFLGNMYKRTVRRIFKLPIRDTDCDFRLIRKSFLDKINLESTDASILPELIKKLELAGAKFAEVEVSHYRRSYGKSNYSAISLLLEKIVGDTKLYFRLRKY